MCPINSICFLTNVLKVVPSPHEHSSSASVGSLYEGGRMSFISYSGQRKSFKFWTKLSLFKVYLHFCPTMLPESQSQCTRPVLAPESLLL